MAQDGDIRVLLAMNLVLSGLFGTAIVWGLDYLGVTEYTLSNVAVAVGVLFLVTYVAVLRE